MWRPIRITFEGNALHGDNRRGGQPLFQIVVLRLAFGHAEPPAVVVDHDADMVRVVESLRAAIERGVVEIPLR
jgi:hypothetical protein